MRGLNKKEEDTNIKYFKNQRVKKHVAEQDFDELMQKKKKFLRQMTVNENIASAKKKNHKVFFTNSNIAESSCKKVKVNTFFAEEENSSKEKDSSIEPSQLKRQFTRMKTKQPLMQMGSLRPKRQRLSMVPEEEELQLPKKEPLNFQAYNNTSLPEDNFSEEEQKVQSYGQDDSFVRNNVEFESLDDKGRKNPPQLELNTFKDEEMFENSGGNFRQLAKKQQENPPKKRKIINLQINVDNLDSYNSNTRRSDQEEKQSSREGSSLRPAKEVAQKPKSILKKKYQNNPDQTPIILKKRNGLQNLQKSFKRQAFTAAKQSEKTKFFKPSK